MEFNFSLTEGQVDALYEILTEWLQSGQSSYFNSGYNWAQIESLYHELEALQNELGGVE